MDVSTHVQRSRNMAAIREKDTDLKGLSDGCFTQWAIATSCTIAGYRVGRICVPRGIAKWFSCTAASGICTNAGPGRVVPATNAEFCRRSESGMLTGMLARSGARDQGWRALVAWECEIRDIEALTQRLVAFWNRRRAAL